MPDRNLPDKPANDNHAPANPPHNHARASTKSDRGILKAETARQKFALRRFEPSADLRPCIEHYWTVRWNLTGQPPYAQTILSFPNINLSFERDNDTSFTGAYGVPRRTYTRHLQGEGEVLGVKFRPGGFHAFWPSPAVLLTGHALPLEDLFGPEAADIGKRVLAETDDEARVQIVETFLRSLRSAGNEQPAAGSLAGEIVQYAIDNRAVAKVEELAERYGMNVRSLQRLFSRYVGVSPKWIIQRFRLQEAAELIEKNGASDWAALAQTLGFYDQAHFIKSFKAMVGRSPEVYSREIATTEE